MRAFRILFVAQVAIGLFVEDDLAVAKGRAGSAGLSAGQYRDMQQYYPIGHYRKFPARVRPLIQRIEYENGICRNAPGDGHASIMACRRRDQLETLLERKGWCWGGGWVEADKHWAPCKRH